MELLYNLLGLGLNCVLVWELYENCIYKLRLIFWVYVGVIGDYWE